MVWIKVSIRQCRPCCPPIFNSGRQNFANFVFLCLEVSSLKNFLYPYSWALFCHLISTLTFGFSNKRNFSQVVKKVKTERVDLITSWLTLSFVFGFRVYKFKRLLLITFQNVVSQKGFIVHLGGSAHMFFLQALGWQRYRTG